MSSNSSSRLEQCSSPYQREQSSSQEENSLKSAVEKHDNTTTQGDSHINKKEWQTMEQRAFARFMISLEFLEVAPLRPVSSAARGLRLTVQGIEALGSVAASWEELAHQYSLLYSIMEVHYQAERSDTRFCGRFVKALEQLKNDLVKVGPRNDGSVIQGALFVDQHKVAGLIENHNETLSRIVTDAIAGRSQDLIERIDRNRTVADESIKAELAKWQLPESTFDSLVVRMKNDVLNLFRVNPSHNDFGLGAGRQFQANHIENSEIVFSGNSIGGKSPLENIIFAILCAVVFALLVIWLTKK